MTLRKHLVALVVTVAALAVSGSAVAAFPNFTDCPREVNACIDIQNTTGALNIKGFNVPLGRSLEIRGGLVFTEAPTPTFVPPRGTNGFFATPVPIPGGLLGIEFPIPGNSVLAITELAGPASSIRIDLGEEAVALPVKVRLINALLGMDCHIGTDSSPVNLNLGVGTTRPPPPNREITGRAGEQSFDETTGTLFVRGIVDVENSFAVPGASRCGLGLGLINALVNAKLRLPSAAGNNSISITNDIALRFV